jgi:glutaconate CoA-transferase, subunit A
MADKRCTLEDVVDSLESGMTIGIGGWGSRRKPMALVRAIARSKLTDLTVVSFGGPDVGILAATGKLRRVVFGFVSLDVVPLEPHFRRARQQGRVEVNELDEGMLRFGLYAACCNLPFLPMRAGLGSDVLAWNPEIKTVTSPYADGETLVAMPALNLDVALVHAHVADASGNARFLGPDPLFDDLFCGAAKRAYVTTERIVPTAELYGKQATPQPGLSRMVVSGVIETPNGAHFTSVSPNYGRDDAFLKAYAATAKDPAAWERFQARFLDVPEADYQANVASGVFS